MNANRFVDELVNYISKSDAVSIAKLINLRSGQYKSVYFNEDNKRYLIDRFQRAPNDVNNWLEVVNYYVLFKNCQANDDIIGAFDSLSKSFKSLIELIKDMKDDNWPLPVLFRMSVDLRLYAYKCDLKKQKNLLFDRNSASKEDAEGTEYSPNEFSEKVAESLMASFRILTSDSKSDSQYSKKWGMMHIINQLFKIYFKINKINLCKPLKRVIENSNLKDAFPQCHQVVYKFFVGRQAMFENDFNTAAEYFNYAFQNCPNKFIKNKKIILVYLIPVNMLRGCMPSETLLVKYDLKPFAELVKAVKQGNIYNFNRSLVEFEDFFIENGVYLFLEKLRMTTYRNLFKTISRLLNTSQIPIEALVEILKYLEESDMDNDACQCILANLIYEGKIKGYISYKFNKLVISKDFKVAFPRLSSISNN